MCLVVGETASIPTEKRTRAIRRGQQHHCIYGKASRDHESRTLYETRFVSSEPKIALLLNPLTRQDYNTPPLDSRVAISAGSSGKYHSCTSFSLTGSAVNWDDTPVRASTSTSQPSSSDPCQHPILFAGGSYPLCHVPVPQSCADVVEVTGTSRTNPYFTQTGRDQRV